MFRDLYGICELDEASAARLTELIRERNKPGVVKWILQDRTGIDLAQVNAIDGPMFRDKTDSSIFMQDIGVAALLGWPMPTELLEKETGVTIKSFKDYGDAIDALFDKRAASADAVKQQSAPGFPQYP